MPNDLGEIVERTAKLSIATVDNKDASYIDKIQSQYIKQDVFLAKELGEFHTKQLAAAKVAFEAKDGIAFQACMDKMSKANEIAMAGNGEEVSKYLAETEDKKEDKTDKVTELSAKIDSITVALEELKSGKFFKFGETGTIQAGPAEEQIGECEKIKHRILHDIDTLLSKNGGK